MITPTKKSTQGIKVLICLILVNLISQVSLAQRGLNGIIKDTKGNAMPYVDIVVRGTTIYTVSDINGAFTLQPPAVPFVLQVSLLGYQPFETKITEISDEPLQVTLLEDINILGEVVVTSRRRREVAQDVPISISALQGRAVEDAGAFNINRVKEIIPSVQLYSSNPRNTTLNIRGLGSTFGLTNDGIDPGVGFYVDGVYYARAAATALDFIDIEQIEVLRGPQGTLFGKNTTAGAFNITTRAPGFTPAVNAEVSYGNYGFWQGKASVTGPLSKKLAGRLSFSGTHRNGLIYNVRTQKYVNTLDNLGFRGQLLFTPNANLRITLAGDITSQHPDGYAQVIAGVVTTKRSAYRQFDQIISDLEYELPSRNPFDRIIDHDTPWRSGNDLGGASVNAEYKIGAGTLTATSAWRFWNWDPSNDRDFTGLPVLRLSQATSKHRQWTQEVRYSGYLTTKLSAVIGGFLIYQDLKSDPYQIEESGSAQWRFSQNSTSDLWKTPGLFDGFGIKTNSRLQTLGAASFAQLDWQIFKNIHVLGGIRYNYDQKEVFFDRQTYGGLQTTDPALIALKNVVYTNQAFQTNVNESNFSGQLTLNYKAFEKINAFATYANSYKPIGVNLGGLPTANGQVLIDLARIKPEYVTHNEIGIKTTPASKTILNIVWYRTRIKNYQTQVQTAEVGVNRGYLANAEKVQVWGIELDGNTKIGNYLSVNIALAYTDGKYISFTNAPVPLEETGSPNAFKDISGGALPGISKWSGSFGGEAFKKAKLLGKDGHFFIAVDAFYRSAFSSSASPSQFLNIEAYTLLNSRIGFRATEGLSVFLWGRNILDKDYFEQLLPAAGNAGHFAGVLGDPLTFGITVRYAYKSLKK